MKYLLSANIYHRSPVGTLELLAAIEDIVEVLERDDLEELSLAIAAWKKIQADTIKAVVERFSPQPPESGDYLVSVTNIFAKG